MRAHPEFDERKLPLEVSPHLPVGTPGKRQKRNIAAHGRRGIVIPDLPLRTRHVELCPHILLTSSFHSAMTPPGVGTMNFVSLRRRILYLSSFSTLQPIARIPEERMLSKAVVSVLFTIHSHVTINKKRPSSSFPRIGRPTTRSPSSLDRVANNSQSPHKDSIC